MIRKNLMTGKGLMSRNRIFNIALILPKKINNKMIKILKSFKMYELRACSSTG